MPKRRVSIQAILLIVSVIFLLLPLGSLYYLRIYQSALIRQTEAELISQAAFVSAIYKTAVTRELQQKAIPIHHYGVPLRWSSESNEPFIAIPATLDLAKDRIYPPRPLPQTTLKPSDWIAQHAGQAIQNTLDDAQRITMSGIKILDIYGTVVNGKQEIGLSFAHSQEFQRARTGHPVSMIRVRRMPQNQAPINSLSRNAPMNVFVALPIVLEDRLIGVAWLNRTPTTVKQALYGKRWDILWAALFILGVTTAITALTSFTITRPIQALVQQTRQVARGGDGKTRPIAHPVSREIAHLSESIATMANELQDRTTYIRDFAAHVSHEFKTPLTAIQGSIELLRDNWQDMPASRRNQFLSNIDEDTHRLQRLVSRLLELAKADMTESIAENTPLIPICKNLKNRFDSQGLTVTIENHDLGAALNVQLTAHSMEAILTHLLENSLQHGATQVTLRLETPHCETIDLTLEDNGPGISEANRQQIFTPFFTTRRRHGGTGLGLSIAQSLLVRQGGEIQVLPAANGAVFQLALPRA